MHNMTVQRSVDYDRCIAYEASRVTTNILHAGSRSVTYN